jgi:hypothetical protein
MQLSAAGKTSAKVSVSARGEDIALIQARWPRSGGSAAASKTAIFAPRMPSVPNPSRCYTTLKQLLGFADQHRPEVVDQP